MGTDEQKLTQKELILAWVKAHGDFKPSSMVGKVFMRQMYGSEIKRRCCELRDAGVLMSFRVGKFVVFTFPGPYQMTLLPISGRFGE